jgi:hypothetical protein
MTNHPLRLLRPLPRTGATPPMPAASASSPAGGGPGSEDGVQRVAPRLAADVFVVGFVAAATNAGVTDESMG